MNKSELEELKELIAAKLDITEFLDILGYDMYDVVEVFSDIINENSEDFVEGLY